ncbi:MAG TPA: response regulator [Chitinophaga sp.]|uniref:response regulator transcription factor n=1 Tax=Chitinophaga sp. TaxID=1869181 RepID=UPI002B81049C|nr:response regulator [Chitinophaga sp.]HVI43925.1 response regulator [Chitinophaga sp.]
MQTAVASKKEAVPSILLVDDEEEILDFLQQVFSDRYTVLRTNLALHALEILQREVVQLIISDVMMPEMDGFEFCRIIKSDKHTSHIPLILLTAKNTLQAKISGLELKADAYIEKPFSVKHLLAQVDSLMANRANVRDYLAGSPLLHIKGAVYSKGDEQLLEQLHTVICRHLEDENLNADKIARALNMTRITLYRWLHQISSITPGALINMTRLQKGAELLASGKYKVYEVSSLVGFSSQSNFARSFHKQFNVTPTQYLQQWQG